MLNIGCVVSAFQFQGKINSEGGACSVATINGAITEPPIVRSKLFCIDVYPKNAAYCAASYGSTESDLTVRMLWFCCAPTTALLGCVV